MRYLFLCTTFASTLLLTGCAGIVGFWMTAGGVAAVPVAGYEMTRDRIVDHSLKPYGAHWIKDGVTKEGRRSDSWSCGAANTVHAADHVVFTKEQRDAVRTPLDKDDYGPDGLLLVRWRICMQSKGYVYLDQCDARCLYP